MHPSLLCEGDVISSLEKSRKLGHQKRPPEIYAELCCSGQPHVRAAEDQANSPTFRSHRRDRRRGRFQLSLRLNNRLLGQWLVARRGPVSNDGPKARSDHQAQCAKDEENSSPIFFFRPERQSDGDESCKGRSNGSPDAAAERDNSTECTTLIRLRPSCDQGDGGRISPRFGCAQDQACGK